MNAIGKIIAAFERKGQLEDTLIVCFSDNGSFSLKEGSGQEYGGNPPLISYPTGSNGPLRGEKSTTYEDGMNALRDGDWKLVTLGSSEWARGLMPGDDRSPQLYNIAHDPCEKDNQAGRRPEILARLLKELEQETARDERDKRLIWGDKAAR